VKTRSVAEQPASFVNLSTKQNDDFIIYVSHHLILGPCGEELSTCPGTPCFMKSLEAIDVQCTCLPKLATTTDGSCYQPYTRGPCQYVKYIMARKYTIIARESHYNSEFGLRKYVYNGS
jgi:hypothetical protein